MSNHESNQEKAAHQAQADDVQPDRPAPMNRRTVVAGTGFLAVAAALAGCSSYGGQGGQGQGAPAAPGTGGAGYPPPAAAPGAPGAAQGQGLARTADIPVGGGQVFPAAEVVVTQPEADTFQAFSAICTHQGCTVNEIADGTINCPCHGSKFSVEDGSVVEGPAKRPLPQREVVVEGDWIQLT